MLKPLEPKLDKLKLAVRAAGGLKFVGGNLVPPVTKQAVWLWCNGRCPVPARRVIQLAKLLKIDPREIRPDVFGAYE